MALRILIASASTDFNTAATWLPAFVPITGDDILINDQTVGALSTGLDQSTKTFASLTIDRLGAFATLAAGRLLCNVTDLYVAGTFDALKLGGTITRATIKANTTAADAIDLDCFLASLAVHDGKVKISGTKVQAASSQWYLSGAEDGDTELVVDSTVDLTTNNTRIQVAGGRLKLSASCDDLIQGGGDIELLGSAALALLIQTGGSFSWKSDGAINMAHVGGGFTLGELTRGRILTNMTTYGDATVDLSAGHNLTLSNSIRQLGINAVQMPIGRAVTFA